jgi:hypothetical protein
MSWRRAARQLIMGASNRYTRTPWRRAMRTSGSWDRVIGTMRTYRQNQTVVSRQLIRPDGRTDGKKGTKEGKKGEKEERRA